MFSKNRTIKFTKDYWDKLCLLKNKIETSDGILVGAGAGMSVSAGLAYSGKRFEHNFADFIEEYGFHDMYSAGFYLYETLEEYWGYWSRYIALNRYTEAVGRPYTDLLGLLQDKDYFVLTTNVDHRFQAAGFDKQRLFYTQGDFGLWQCSRPCHRDTYDNETTIAQMVSRQKNRKIPASLVPHCPRCGAPLCMNLRVDSAFVEDSGFQAAADRYHQFVKKHRDSNMLYLELGVGENTPGIIKYPFWNMTSKNPKAAYVSVNTAFGFSPGEIADRSVYIQEDIGRALQDLPAG